MGSLVDLEGGDVTTLGGHSRFREVDVSRYHCHGIFPYPAMMVPRLQGDLMEKLLAQLPRPGKVYDPFMGSGTVLSESLYRGADFFGTDINPLSLLCCEVKSDPFSFELADFYIDVLSRKLGQSKKLHKEFSFFGAEKWFPSDVLKALAEISSHIGFIEEKWCRRIFWLALSECVRKFSRTRLSTYKLHIDKAYKTPRISDIYNTFVAVCRRNITLKKESWGVLSDRGLLINGAPSSEVNLELTDARCAASNVSADLVVTSPPYGDNQTTVTYGQFSYLPLQFIDLNDIDHKFDRSLLASSNSIDAASLGGSLRFWRNKMSDVEEQSETLRQTLGVVRSVGRGGEKRLASFAYDLHEAVVAVAQRVNSGGYVMMTLGNRNINGVAIPLDEIVHEFFGVLGFEQVNKISRRIGKKRMAGSMNAEEIIIMQKA